MPSTEDECCSTGLAKDGASFTSGSSKVEYKFKYCRMCALELKCGVYIFGEEGKRLQIPEKIRKTMGILVLEEDTLPKKICTDCCSSLEDYAQYKDTVLDAQEKLASIAKKLEKSIEVEVILSKTKAAPLSFGDSSSTSSSSNNSTSNNNSHHHLQQLTSVISKHSPKVKLNQAVLESKEEEEDDDEIQLDLSTPDNIYSETSTPPSSSSCCKRNNFKRDTTSTNSSINSSTSKPIAIKCGYCLSSGDIFYDKQAVLAHILKTHPEIKHKVPRYRCSECPKVTDKFSALKAHTYRHRSTVGPYSCPTVSCTKSYPIKAMLDSHQLSRHSSSATGKVFSCRDCGKRFHTKTGLSCHISTKHVEELPGRMSKDVDDNLSDNSSIPDCNDDSISMDENFTSTTADNSNNYNSADVLERQRCVPIPTNIGETIDNSTPHHHHHHHHRHDSSSSNNNASSSGTAIKGSCTKLPVFLTTPKKNHTQAEDKDYEREMQQFRKFPLPVTESSSNNSQQASNCIDNMEKAGCSKKGISTTTATSAAANVTTTEWNCNHNHCDEGSTSSTNKSHETHNHNHPNHHHHHHSHNDGDVKTPRYNCNDCGSSYLQKATLDHHKRVHHTPDAPKHFRCGVCGIEFYELKFLTQHSKIHGEPSLEFQCSVCKKVYKSRRCLRRHLQLHSSSNKKYVCSLCNKAFRVKSKLEEHENSHTGRRPLSCPFCVKAFNGHPNYVKHIRRKHPSEINRENKIPPPRKTENSTPPSCSLSSSTTNNNYKVVSREPASTSTSSTTSSSGTTTAATAGTSPTVSSTTATLSAVQQQAITESSNNNSSSNSSLPQILIPIPVPAHNSSSTVTDFQQQSHCHSQNHNQHQHVQQQQQQQPLQQPQSNWHHNSNNNNSSSSSSSGHVSGKNYLNPSGSGITGNLSSSSASAISMNAMDLVDCAIQNALVGNGQENNNSTHHNNHHNTNGNNNANNNNSYDNVNGGEQSQLQNEPMELSYKLESSAFQDMPMELTKVFQRDPLELCVRQHDLNQLMDLSSRVDTSGMVGVNMNMNMNMNMGGVNVHKLDLTERELMDLSGAFRQPIDLISRTDDTSHDLYNEGSLVDLSLRSNFGQDHQSASSFLRELIDLSARSDSFHGELDLTKPHHSHTHQNPTLHGSSSSSNSNNNNNNNNNNNAHLHHHHSNGNSGNPNPNLSTIHNCHANGVSPPKNGTTAGNNMGSSLQNVVYQDTMVDTMFNLQN